MNVPICQNQIRPNGDLSPSTRNRYLYFKNTTANQSEGGWVEASVNTYQSFAAVHLRADGCGHWLGHTFRKAVAFAISRFSCCQEELYDRHNDDLTTSATAAHPALNHRTRISFILHRRSRRRRALHFELRLVLL